MIGAVTIILHKDSISSKNIFSIEMILVVDLIFLEHSSFMGIKVIIKPDKINKGEVRSGKLEVGGWNWEAGGLSSSVVDFPNK